MEQGLEGLQGVVPKIGAITDLWLSGVAPWYSGTSYYEQFPCSQMTPRKLQEKQQAIKMEPL